MIYNISVSITLQKYSIKGVNKTSILAYLYAILPVK